MADEHLRYERLAVGHVVGGLDEVDSARFRSHLVACRDCRTRVAELRGIASDLVATEREERAAGASVGRTELAERVEEEAPPRARETSPATSWPWRVVAIGLVPLLVLGALAWAVWMRGEARILEAMLGNSNEALLVLAEGEQLDLDVAPAATGVEGVAAATGDDVVLDLVGLPAIDPDQTVRAALVDGTGAVVAAGTAYTSSQMGETGRLVDILPRAGAIGAVEVVVHVRRLEGAGFAVVDELVSARLPLLQPSAPAAEQG